MYAGVSAPEMGERSAHLQRVDVLGRIAILVSLDE